MEDNNEPIETTTTVEETNPSEPKVVSLKDILNEKTEAKPESKTEPEPEAKRSEGEGEAKKLSLDPEAVADNLIDLVDGVQQMVMPYMYQMALFNQTERSILKQIARTARESAKKHKGGKMTIEYSEEESKLLEEYADYSEYCDELPFSDKEIKLIKKPLVEVLKESKFTMTPKGSLLTAAFMLMVPRTLPIVMKKVGSMFGMK